MSDYLDNLVSRTLNLGRVVQPRLASLFEPLAAEARPEPIAHLETRPVFEDSSPIESQVSTLLLPTPTSEQGMRMIPPTSSEGSSPPAHSVIPPALLGFAQFPTDGVRRLAFSEPNQQVTPKFSAEGSLQHEETDSIKSSSEAGNYQTRPRIRPEVRLSSPASDRTQDQSSFGSSNPDSIFADGAVPRPVLPDRPVSTKLSVPTQERETVVVTIGRVDVRAVFTPPTVARTDRPQQPKPMSLDEYLKQRREGRR